MNVFRNPYNFKNSKRLAEFVDEDNDGIHEGDDYCVKLRGALVDENGCSVSEKDTDGDGVKNNLENVRTLPGEEVDSDGR